MTEENNQQEKNEQDKIEQDKNQRAKMLYVRDLSEYLYCPRKIYLKLYKGCRENVNPFMIKGRIKHEVNDLLIKKESEIVSGIFTDLSLEEIKKLYYDNISEFFKQAFKKNASACEAFSISYSGLLAEIIKKFKKEIDEKARVILKFIPKYKGTELWQKLEPKYLSEFKIFDESLGLSGRVDKIEFSKDIVPIEVKTSDAPKSNFDASKPSSKSYPKPYPSDLVQLSAYALLLEHKFSRKIFHGKIFYRNKKFDVEITEEMKQEVFGLIEKIKNMVFIPPILSNFQKCKNCGLKDECMNIKQQ